MGKIINSNIFFGTTGSPQVSIEQSNYDKRIEEILKYINELELAIGIKELEKLKVKFKKEDVLFVTRDATNQLIWLEKGNPTAGLEHILYGNENRHGHLDDFRKNCNIDIDTIVPFLKDVVSSGVIIKNEIKKIGERLGFERIYLYKNCYYFVAGIGINCFIVSFYPKRRKK